jgi:hypothetical protein
MWKLGFFLIALWLVGGFYFSLAAVSRYVFDPEAYHRALGLDRRTTMGHRLFAAWLWPLYLPSKSGRQFLFFMFEDKQGVHIDEKDEQQPVRRERGKRRGS